MKRLALLFFALVSPHAPAASQPSAGTGALLEAGFRQPPATARPHVYWIWMNGNVTREGITADLEAMAEGGIGGGLIFSLAGPMHKCDTPAGPADYLGPQWLDLMKHAASEAGRLGLELGMHNCAGWATTGGPWVKPELAMQKLVSSETTVEGGGPIELRLPQTEVTLGFYRDIAVYAIPAVADGPLRLPKWESKAGQRGGPGGRQPDLQPLPKDAAIPLDAVVCVSERLREDGTLVWDAPPGRWKIVRLGHTPTGATNAPAPASATGLEIDKLRREGMDVHWRHGIQPVLDHLAPFVGKSFKTIEIDSYEAGLHHWTPRLREEFEERRGYDPTPYLLALTGRVVGDGPTTERFLWDIRRTISDLFADNYYGYMADLCHQHGLEFTTEPYTSCFEGLQVAAKADIPMAEFWADGNYSFSMRLSASLAHIHGRPVAAAEAFTAGPPLGRWLDHPGSLKRVGDRAWTEGINRFVLHSYAHQPWMDLVPGMTMGQYGCHFSRHSTWWKPGRAWLKYIARSQFLLQSGEPVADVLCFAGNAAPNGAVRLDELKRAGYDYDSCGTDILAGLTVTDGDVVLPSGKRYRLLVLPDHPFHTPAFARKLRELVRDGATVVGPKPLQTPSLADFPASEDEVRAIGEEVWGKCDGKAVKSNRFGKGEVFHGMSPAEVLAGLNIRPAVQLAADAGRIAWIQRRTEDADVFLVSNQSDAAVSAMVSFRAAGRQPEFWDAEQGTIRPAAGWTDAGGQVNVPLDLEPEKSVFVVFRNPAGPRAEPSVRVERLKPMTLAGPWTVRFPPDRGAPAEATLEKPVSWSDHPDPGIRYFSGTATAAIRFDVPEDFLTPSGEVWLDLGEVAVMAEIRLNGRNLGVHWHRPFSVEVGSVLRAGSNTLEVDVTNLWINRLIGDEQQPADCEWTGQHLTRWPEWLANGKPRPQPSRITFTTWKHWNASDPLQPSGLLGPVTLRPTRLVARP